MTVRTKFVVRSFIPIPEEYSKIGQFPNTPTLLFLPIFNGLLFGWTL